MARKLLGNFVQFLPPPHQIKMGDGKNAVKNENIQGCSKLHEMARNYVDSTFNVFLNRTRFCSSMEKLHFQEAMK